LNGCNNAIVIPEFKIEKRLQVGDNIIEFTPTKTGKFRYSCWMGMIRGTITVVAADTADTSQTNAAGEVSQGKAEAAELDSEDDNDLGAPACPCCRGRS
jgi:plastocyanin domain-containing protein